MWHVSHQFDMVHALRDECDFYFCLNIKKQWDGNKRKAPENITFVTHYQKGFYDIAILHIDQQVVNPNDLKTLVYNEFNSLIQDIPKIVICHGTPCYPEYYRLKHRANGLSLLEMDQMCIKDVKKIIGDNLMVVNSFDAATEKEWGFGHPIIHGINPDDWWDLPKEPRAFTAISVYGLDKAVNRECLLDVSEELYTNFGHTLAYANLNIDTGASVEDYKNYLGRSLIYLDTSVRTPMNRARTEAFLSGCCVLQVEGAHDLTRWAKHMENIILVPNDPAEIAKLIADLIENRYQEAIAIGKRGKAMAKKVFDPERYKQDWLKLFKQTMR